MDDRITIRTAQESDLERVCHLVEKALDPNDAAYVGYITRSKCVSLVAECNNAIIGFITLRLDSEDVILKRWHVYPKYVVLVVVEESYRKRHVAKKLFSEVARRVAQLRPSGSEIVLHTKDANVPIFERIGFRVVGVDGTYRGGHMGYLMQCDVQKLIHADVDTQPLSR